MGFWGDVLRLSVRQSPELILVKAPGLRLRMRRAVAAAPQVLLSQEPPLLCVSGATTSTVRLRSSTIHNQPR